jgi:hypothetical protein
MSSRSYRNNNPGNIVYGPFAMKYGASLENGDNPRFAKFRTAAGGTMALIALLNSPNYINLTIRQAIERYAPSNENDTNAYIQFVSTYSTLPETATISWMNALQFLDFVRAIIKREGYKED